MSYLQTKFDHPDIQDQVMDYVTKIQLGMLFFMLSSQIDTDASKWDLHLFADVGSNLADNYVHANVTYRFDWKTFCWRGAGVDSPSTLPVAMDSGFPVVPINAAN